MAEQARDAGWTHEDYLAAVLERDVSARTASGAQLRIRAAGFGAVKPWRIPFGSRLLYTIDIND